MLRSRGFWISTASTVVFLVVIAVLLLTAPGIHNLHEGLFSVHDMRAALPSVWDRFKINLKMMAIAEVLVLICALGVAILRGLPGPAAFPLRVVAIVYTDVFRGLPTILVAIFIGLGFPSLGLSVISTQSPFTYGVVTLTLVYSAYVAEVYRAGIESVHPSQTAAARSLGLSTARPSVRGPAAGGPARDPAAAQRLHRPPEGHRAGVPARRRGGRPGRPGSRDSSFNFTPY